MSNSPKGTALISGASRLGTKPSDATPELHGLNCN
jgi:hypothetical protein